MIGFSVVITTRNRPGLLRAALGSVLHQAGAAFEVVVVNDGTSDQHRPALDEIRAESARDGHPVTFLDLPQTASGHGPYYALNAGVRQSRCEFVGFLDDDDVWSDPEYLAKAARAIEQGEVRPDLLFFDQAAFGEVGQVSGPIWLEDLGSRLKATAAADAAGAYEVTVAQLLTAHGFCHVNTMIVSRAFFDTVGGFDQTLRYEGDREFFLRSIDRARSIKYLPQVTARHNLPDPRAKANSSTAASQLERHLDQLVLLNKVARTALHSTVVSYARRHRRYALSRATKDAFLARNWRLTLGLLFRKLNGI